MPRWELSRQTTFIPTGSLTLTANEGYRRDGRPAEFRDTKTTPLERRLPGVLREPEIRALEDDWRRQQEERRAQKKRRRWEQAMDQAKRDLRETHRADVQRWEFENTSTNWKLTSRAVDGSCGHDCPPSPNKKPGALLLTHYAIRHLMSEAADDIGIDPDQLSFIRSLRVIRRQISRQANFSPQRLDKAINDTLDEIIERLTQNVATAPTHASSNEKPLAARSSKGTITAAPPTASHPAHTCSHTPPLN